MEQSKIVIFTVLTGVDEPDLPDTLILSSLWGEVLVARIKELVEDEKMRNTMEGFAELQEFFHQEDTAYVTEREERAMHMMMRLGVKLDEATLTGLETWHPLSQEFAPSVAYVFTGLWGRLTAPFKGSTSSGWAWNEHHHNEDARLAPDQARLAFAMANAMASLTLDGVMARVDPEDERDLENLGALVLKYEQEGILEGEETIGMRALQLGGDESQEQGIQRCHVSWLGLEMAWREPLGRIGRGGRRELPLDGAPRPLRRYKERMEDLIAWEESVSFVTLLGPEHRKPIEGTVIRLPEPPERRVLKAWDESKNRQANERLGMDPDDTDLARQRFAGLCLGDGRKSQTRTSSLPPTPNVDVHGLWEEERRRQAGERHQGPPRLKWNPPIRKETMNKRHRDPEDRVKAWGEEDDEISLTYTWPPRSKKRREGDESRSQCQARVTQPIAHRKVGSFYPNFQPLKTRPSCVWKKKKLVQGDPGHPGDPAQTQTQVPGSRGIEHGREVKKLHQHRQSHRNRGHWRG